MKVTKTTGKTMALTQPAQQIWLAGLGAFALAEEEGGKLFGTLVKKGRVVEKAGATRLQKVRKDIVARTEDIREIPMGAMTRIGNGVDASLTAALHRLGVPTKKEIAVLTRRVEELTHALAKPQPKRVRPKRVRRRATKVEVATTA